MVDLIFIRISHDFITVLSWWGWLCRLIPIHSPFCRIFKKNQFPGSWDGSLYPSLLRLYSWPPSCFHMIRVLTYNPGAGQSRNLSLLPLFSFLLSWAHVSEISLPTPTWLLCPLLDNSTPPPFFLSLCGPGRSPFILSETVWIVALCQANKFHSFVCTHVDASP